MYQWLSWWLEIMPYLFKWLVFCFTRNIVYIIVWHLIRYSNWVLKEKWKHIQLHCFYGVVVEIWCMNYARYQDYPTLNCMSVETRIWTKTLFLTSKHAVCLCFIQIGCSCVQMVSHTLTAKQFSSLPPLLHLYWYCIYTFL